MAIPEKLLKFKFHILFAVAFSLLIVSLIYLAPKFVHVLAYFWPLFLSTALFLVAVVVFARTLPPGTEAHGEKAGEGLLSYVAAVQPEVEEVEEIEEPAEEEEEEAQVAEEESVASEHKM